MSKRATDTQAVLPGHADQLSRIMSASLRPCRKRPITVHALQMDEPFRVDSMEGDYKQGKPGDYLMCGAQGELYICDREIFEATYDFIEDD